MRKNLEILHQIGETGLCPRITNFINKCQICPMSIPGTDYCLLPADNNIHPSYASAMAHRMIDLIEETRKCTSDCTSKSNIVNIIIQDSTGTKTYTVGEQHDQK